VGHQEKPALLKRTIQAIRGSFVTIATAFALVTIAVLIDDLITAWVTPGAMPDQPPTAAIARFPGMLVMLVINFVTISLPSYFLTVAYLRTAVKKNPPTYSLGNWWYWFRKIMACDLVIMLWFLIPFIGIFFSMRADARYKAVSPMAILRRPQPLKTSRELAQDDWGKIFWGAFCLNFILCIPMIAVFGWFVLPVIKAVMAHPDPQAMKDVLKTMMPTERSPVAMVLLSVWKSLGFLVNSIYDCTVYAFLLRKQKAQMQVAEQAA